MFLAREKYFLTCKNHLSFKTQTKQTNFQGIDLLATTPSDLAMSLKTETINVEVKNRMVTERITVARDREQISKFFSGSKSVSFLVGANQ